VRIFQEPHGKSKYLWIEGDKYLMESLMASLLQRFYHIFAYLHLPIS
jgi:hypothetical protein